jgi:hypothetical protein
LSKTTKRFQSNYQEIVGAKPLKRLRANNKRLGEQTTKKILRAKPPRDWRANQ